MLVIVVVVVAIFVVVVVVVIVVVVVLDEPKRGSFGVQQLTNVFQYFLT